MDNLYFVLAEARLESFESSVTPVKVEKETPKQYNVGGNRVCRKVVNKADVNTMQAYSTTDYEVTFYAFCDSEEKAKLLQKTCVNAVIDRVKTALDRSKKLAQQVRQSIGSFPVEI